MDSVHNDVQLKMLVIGCSLNPDSRSTLLALEATHMLKAQGIQTQFLDLRETDMPFCDGNAAYDHPTTKALKTSVSDADAIVLAAPVYNYDLNATAKNLIELTGGAWQDKVVSFLCAAGGRSSYMSPIGLANSLMFDFRSYIVPRFVYAIGEDFSGDELRSDIRKRVEELVQATIHLASGLALTKQI